jgi:hypothetical protein
MIALPTDTDVQNNFAAANDNFSLISSYNNPDNEAAKFLRKLSPDGPWVLTAIVPDGPTITETVHDADDVVNFVRVHEGTRNIY